MGKITQRITPFLWFDDRAEEAAGFYVSIFPDSRIKGVHRYTDEVSKAAGMLKMKKIDVEPLRRAHAG